VVNHSWGHPAANLVTSRSTTINPSHTTLNDRLLSHGTGHYGWHPYHPSYGWGDYYFAYHPSYYSYHPSYGWGGYYSYYPTYHDYYSSYGTYPYGSAYLSTVSQTDSGTSTSSAPVPREEGAANTTKETAAVQQRMDVARRAFQQGNYAEADRECEQALRLLPRDANLHEFRALCQFAQSKYQDAAATLYEVLTAGPGWDWNTVSSFYPSAQTYTTQLRTLERYVREYPRDPGQRFVLAYHYLVLDEGDAIRDQLEEVVKLQPNDKVAAGILEALEKAKKIKDQARADKPAPGR
jgi:tetratricopeptide (TPR) repeat protein